MMRVYGYIALVAIFALMQPALLATVMSSFLATPKLVPSKAQVARSAAKTSSDTLRTPFFNKYLFSVLG